MFNDSQREQFLSQGFIRIDNAFSQETAAAGRAILWADTGCDPEDPSTWTRPVIRLGDYPQEPFRQAANTPVLHAAFDELVGAGRWIPRQSLGTFPIRFPNSADPGDTGWHVDASFPPDEPTDSFLHWRINVKSRGRALLMLFLFSDVGDLDAPTRIRLGSHLPVARLLAPAGDAGVSLLELAGQLDSTTAGLPEALATGSAGTVYLCHPFLVHAAQPHHGTAPRFMAQPPLYPQVPIELDRPDGAFSLVERGILRGLDRT